MGILSSLFGSLDDNTAVTHPCANCESDCKAYPDSCDECRPYKEKLTELLYNVDNIEAFRAKYEVISESTVNAGNSTCPVCGAPNPVTVFACEYCGSAIRESNGKIQVTSASEIPNPILEAQDVIFERRALINQYSGLNETTGILDAISSLFSGEDDSNSLGNRMTEQDIKDAAEAYSVSVSAYLQGLDMGKYLTLEQKKKQDSEAQSTSYYAAAGAAGLGTIGAASIFSNQTNSNHNNGYYNQRPPMPPQQNNHYPQQHNTRPEPPKPPQSSMNHSGNASNHNNQRPVQQPAQKPKEQLSHREDMIRPNHTNTQTQRPGANSNASHGMHAPMNNQRHSSESQRPGVSGKPSGAGHSGSVNSGNMRRNPGSNRGPGKK